MMENRLPKVSIIVPVYNVSQYLPQCLDSLKNQTLSDIEIICVNDASTDNSLDILYDYAAKDERFVIINLPENRRQGGARNAGIKAAKGDFLGFVDSDDWVDENMYGTLYHKAIMEDADMVCADYYVCGEKNVLATNGTAEIFSLSRDEINKYFILNGGRLVTNIIKRKLFVEHELYFPENVIYEDNAIGAALYLLAENLVKIYEPFYFYRVNNQSVTHSFNNFHFFDRLKTSEIFLSHMKNLGFYACYKSEIECRFIELYIINSIFGAIRNFNLPVGDYINEIKTKIKILIPDWKNNKYYRRRFSFLRRLLVSLVLIQPNICIDCVRVGLKIRDMGKGNTR